MRSTIVLLSLLLAAAGALGDTWTVVPFQPEVAVGGRAVSVAVNPTDSRVALVASESGGLFLTRDDGVTWTHVDGVRPHRMVDVAFAPGRGDIIIATAGNEMSATNPLGIWRSADGGSTWTQVTPPDACHRYWTNAWGISFLPGTSRVYVATDCGLLASEDLGLTWTALAGPRTTAGPRFLSVKAAGDVLHACTSSGLWRRPFAGAGWVGPSTEVGGCTTNTLALDTSPLESNVVFYVDGAMRLFQSVDSGARWTLLHDSAANSRPGWVRTVGVSDAEFAVYWGDGYSTYRQICRRGTGCAGAGTTIPMRADSNSIAFDASTRCPKYVVSDGGIHRNAAPAPGEACPWSFTQVSNGRSGYSALQLYEVTSQRHDTGWRDDVYFGTQDNNLYASIDGGFTWPGAVGAEGFAIHVAPHARHALADTIVGVSCAECNPFKSRRGFTEVTAWSRPTIWTSSATTPPQMGFVSNSFLLAPGVHAIAVQRGPDDLRIFTTRDGSATWTDAGRLPFIELRGTPTVVGPFTNPSILWGYRKPGNRLGLGRIDNVLGGRATWVYLDGGSGVPESIGSYCMGAGTFSCPVVYAANPRNLAHMMVVDAATGGVMVTRDGRTWTADDRLNALIRGAGATAANLTVGGWWPGLQVQTITFHPRNAEIFVGTESQGIFYSGDDGMTWQQVPNSSQIRVATSFAFGFDGSRDREVVYVSSYGRGLWKLRRIVTPRFGSGSGGMTVRGSGFDLDLFEPWANHVAVDPVTGGPLRFPLGPDDCPRCLITLLDGNGQQLAVDASGKQTDGAFVFETCEPCLKLENAGVKIGGAVLEDGNLVAVLARTADTQEPLPAPKYEPAAPNPPAGPYVLLAGSVPGATLPATTPGRPVTAFGSGFCGKPDCGGVTVRVADEVIAENVKVSEDGSFQFSFVLRAKPEGAPPIGPMAVTFTQKSGGQDVFSDTTSLLLNRSEGAAQEK